MTHNHIASLVMLVIIHLVSGVSAAGIDLAINNMAIKLAPANEAISYISARNIVVALFAAAGPIVGGLMADFFSTHQFNFNIAWEGPAGVSTFHLLELQNWNFFFVISAVLALFSMRLLNRIREQGEAHKEMVTLVMRKSFFRGLRKNMSTEAMRYRITHPVLIPGIMKRMRTIKLWTESH